MIAQLDSINGSSTYELEIHLNATKPPVWRRLQVPGNANLGWLHAVFQVAMGWTNSHLHLFSCGKRVYADPSAGLDESETGPPVLDERKVTLSQVMHTIGDEFVYEYDFGDCWRHVVTVEKIQCEERLPANGAVCLGGKRACPPEDSGGESGYHQLINILRNRKHPEHNRMKEWLGRPLYAERFDLAATNIWLRKLKWPRVTEVQLRKVLMARDGYHE